MTMISFPTWLSQIQQFNLLHISFSVAYLEIGSFSSDEGDGNEGI